MSEEEVIDEFISEMIQHYQQIRREAEKAISQISSESDFNWQPDKDSNSIAILMRHMAGNMKSRWTDFLLADGEKPFRKRDEEFNETIVLPRSEVQALWNDGWELTLQTISSLNKIDLQKTIYIRNEPSTVIKALYRQLTHYATHVGQILYICKHLLGEKWNTLSRPKAK